MSKKDHKITPPSANPCATRGAGTYYKMRSLISHMAKYPERYGPQKK